MVKTCKKLVSALLVVITLFSFTAFSVGAVGEFFTTDDEMFTCKVVADGKVEITQYCESSKEVTIPETVKDSKGNIYTVTSLGYDIFEGNTVIEKLSIPGTVKSIGREQFQSFSSLKNLTLNEGTETIGGSAFWDCLSLEAIDIPDSVKTIGTYAFGDCKALKSVSIGYGVTEIPSTAFDMCTSLETVYLGENVTSVNATAFRGCSALKDIYAFEKLESFPLDSVDISKVTFHCYKDTKLYDFLTENDALIAVYELTGITVSVDIEKQKYEKTDSVELHKDGLTVTAKYSDAPDRNVTDLCTVSTADDFTTAGDKTAVASYCEKSANYTVKVFDLTFNGNPANIIIYYKDAYKFTALTPDIPEDAKVVWSTSNPKVLTVDQNGNITTIKRGTATITAKLQGTDTSVSCNVTVKYRWWQWILIIVLFGWIWY